MRARHCRALILSLETLNDRVDELKVFIGQAVEGSDDFADKDWAF